ncbi:MAG TPA: type II secretion system F family protein, partial [Polyangia bacterium]|nr:type II secretion system F family protein [Polyangia bacterium]
MTAFVWEARGRAGEIKTGVMEADDPEAVEARLKGQLLVPTSVRKQPREINLPFGTGVKTTDVVVFTRMFATMIDSGLPIVQCLELLSQQSENKRFGKVLAQVKGSVEGGLTLSDALAKHPKIFDDLFVNLIAAGEAGGILDGILQRLSVYMEKAMKLKRRVKGAMVYPISIIGIAALVVTILLTKVIPVFEKMFKDFGGGQLPAPTRVVIAVSHGLAHYLPFIVAFLIAGAIALRMVLRNPKGRLAFDGLLLKLPVLGAVLRKVVVARFTRTMGTLLTAGVPILDALEICAKTAGNTVVQAGIMYARHQISEGKDMATPLAFTGLFPPMVVQMIGV